MAAACEPRHQLEPLMLRVGTSQHRGPHRALDGAADAEVARLQAVRCKHLRGTTGTGSDPKGPVCPGGFRRSIGRYDLRWRLLSSPLAYRAATHPLLRRGRETCRVPLAT